MRMSCVHEPSFIRIYISGLGGCSASKPGMELNALNRLPSIRITVRWCLNLVFGCHAEYCLQGENHSCGGGLCSTYKYIAPFCIASIAICCLSASVIGCSSNGILMESNARFNSCRPGKYGGVMFIILIWTPYFAIKRVSQPSHRILKKAGMFRVALPHSRDEKTQQQHSSRCQAELAAADLQLHS